MSQHIHELFRNAQAMNNKVVIEVIEKEEKTLSSGIILTGESVDQTMEDFRIGRVVSSGCDDIYENDRVIYLRYHGDVGGENMVVLDGKQIIARVTNREG